MQQYFIDMKNEVIPYCSTGYFSKIMCDYLAAKEGLDPFYSKQPTKESLLALADQKSQWFSKEKRQVLVKELTHQNKDISLSAATKKNIQALASPNTLTITTGHQLNIFTGPLYFFYKILDVLQASKKLNKSQEKSKFVPVFWMATEDHDFEEINHFHFKEQKITWNSTQTGAVGRFSTEGLDEVAKQVEELLGNGKNAMYLKELFRKAYTKHETLAAATRYLVNELFGDLGLVIIDGDSRALKQFFTPVIKAELYEQKSYKEISQTTSDLIEAGYHEQVHSREINLFYLTETNRLRIAKTAEGFTLVDGNKDFTQDSLLEEVEKYPERFSPNALLRPVYQEMVLPNVAYIGGGGELAYWLQLKDYFETIEVPFPALVLRTSMLLLSEKQKIKLDKLNTTSEVLFLDLPSLEANWAKKLSEFPVDFSTQKKHLEKQFADLYLLAEKTDASFLGAVAAQERKQIKGLEHLEKRLLKAQKKKYASEIARLTTLQTELFPQENLQERINNFSEFYLAYGDKLVDDIIKETNPLEGAFKVVVL